MHATHGDFSCMPPTSLYQAFGEQLDTMGLVDPNSVSLPVSAFFAALQQWKQLESSVRWQ